MNSVRVASHLLNWGVGTSMGTEEIKSQVLTWLSEKGNDEQVAFSRKLSSVYDAYQELLGSDAMLKNYLRQQVEICLDIPGVIHR